MTGIVAGACTVLLGHDGSSARSRRRCRPTSPAGSRASSPSATRCSSSERGDGHRVTAVLPRRSLLSRADPHVPRRRRAIAANIDLVVVVVAAEAPSLHPRLIDRYLVAVEQLRRPAGAGREQDRPARREAAARAARAPAAVPVARRAGAAVQRRAAGTASTRCARRWQGRRASSSGRAASASRRCSTRSAARPRPGPARCAPATAAAATPPRRRRSTTSPAASA